MSARPTSSPTASRASDQHPGRGARARHADVAVHLGDNKSARLVVYCASGQRAGKAKQQLDAAGYKNVVNGGGLDDLEP
jgi:rhodanese-related sulfurtransferase